MDAATDTIRVETRPGETASWVDHRSDGWVVIANFTDIVGQGIGTPTPLPDFASPVVIPTGTKQAFYVTTSPVYPPADLWLSEASALGDVAASNADIEILDGYAGELVLL